MPELPALGLANLHLVTVPNGAPPYDCQVHGSPCQAAAAAEVATAEAGLGPPAEVAPAAAGQMPAPGRASAGVVPAPAEAAAAAAADPATAWPRQLALVIVEVLAGARPGRQLVPLATDRVRARVRGLAPLLASGRQPRVVRIVTSRPAVRVVEMTVVVDFGPRSRALAMRFEHVAARPAAPGWPTRPARWLCTALEAG
jgi:Family of unknown function (DUF6459)